MQRQSKKQLSNGRSLRALNCFLKFFRNQKFKRTQGFFKHLLSAPSMNHRVLQHTVLKVHRSLSQQTHHELLFVNQEIHYEFHFIVYFMFIPILCFLFSKQMTTLTGYQFQKVGGGGTGCAVFTEAISHQGAFLSWKQHEFVP